MFSDDETNSEPDFTPAVMQRPKIANHIVSERVAVDTQDREDHTFCGMMFDVKATSSLPIEFLEIQSVAVRGDLGPMTVWTVPESYRTTCDGSSVRSSEWKLIYEETHAPSFQEPVPLELSEPLRLKRGEGCGLFVHSKKHGDSSVVYDNMRHRDVDNDLLAILPGMAALDCRPFGEDGIWGEGWRNRREFVGRVNVGICWKLWNPEVNFEFPCSFRSAAKTLVLCATRPDSPVHYLSDAVIFYILNMCRWDWFEEIAPVSVDQQRLLEPTGFPRHLGFHSHRPLFGNQVETVFPRHGGYHGGFDQESSDFSEPESDN